MKSNRFVCCRFVTFGSDDEAAAAVATFNDYEIEEKRLRVMINDRSGARPQGDSKPGGGMPWGSAGGSGGQSDGGIFIENGEMNGDFSLEGQSK